MALVAGVSEEDAKKAKEAKDKAATPKGKGKGERIALGSVCRNTVGPAHLTQHALNNAFFVPVCKRIPYCMEKMP